MINRFGHHHVHKICTKVKQEIITTTKHRKRNQKLDIAKRLRVFYILLRDAEERVKYKEGIIRQ